MTLQRPVSTPACRASWPSGAAARWFGAHGHRITVVADDAILRSTEALTVPPFTSFPVRNAEPGWTIRVHREESTRHLDSEALARLPMVDFATNRWYVVRRQPDIVEVVIIDEGTAPARLVSRPRLLTADLFIERGDAPIAHWPSRLVKMFTGSRLLGDSWTAIHASSFVSAGGAVVCTGTPGQGKSSLTFAATVICGASFMADDITLLRPEEGGGVTAFGWPRRIALPAGLLRRTASRHLRRLRRAALPTSQTSASTRARGPRIALDPDEHRQLLGVRYVSSSPLRAVVAIETRPGQEQVSASTLAKADRATVLTAMLSTPSHRRVMTDPLKVFGPSLAGSQSQRIDIPGDLPVVVLRCGPDLVDRAVEVWRELGHLVTL